LISSVTERAPKTTSASIPQSSQNQPTEPDPDHHPPHQQAHLGWPEVIATALLAASHLILLLAAVALAVGWLLFGLPDEAAHKLIMPRLFRNAPTWVVSLLSAASSTLIPGWWAGGGSAAASPAASAAAAVDPASAFTRLRYLSLRRCTLADSSAAQGDGSSSGQSSGQHRRTRSGGGGGVFALWAAARAAGASAVEQCAADAGGRRVAAPNHRRRACSTAGAALLHWLLPRACAVAQLAGRAARLLAPPLSFHPPRSEPSSLSTTQHQRAPLKPPPAAAPLAALLGSCPHLRFADLTFISGAATSPSEMAALVVAMRRAGNVHYLAIAQPGRLPIEAVGAAQAGSDEGGSDTAGDAGAGGGTSYAGSDGGSSGGEESEDEDEASGSDGMRAGGGNQRHVAAERRGLLGWSWWGGRSGGRGDAAGSGGGGVQGAIGAAQRRRHKAVRKPVGPLLLECGSLDEVIARELQL